MVTRALLRGRRAHRRRAQGRGQGRDRREHRPVRRDRGRNPAINLKPYAKAVIAAAVAGLTALQAAIADGTIAGTEWVTIALATVGAVAVLLVPNKPANGLLT